MRDHKIFCRAIHIDQAAKLIRADEQLIRDMVEDNETLETAAPKWRYVDEPFGIPTVRGLVDAFSPIFENEIDEILARARAMRLGAITIKEIKDTLNEIACLPVECFDHTDERNHICGDCIQSTRWWNSRVSP